MKWPRLFIKIIAILVGLVLLLILVFNLSGDGHLPKAVWSAYLHGETGPGIYDQNKFVHREVFGSNPIPWTKSNSDVKLSKKQDSLIKSWETVAFLVLKNKEILFEKYYLDHNKDKLSNSFSVAKSFVSIAIGSAIQQGFIKGLNQPVSDFLPEFNSPSKQDINIGHLLSMSSGINFGESYGDPFGFMAKAYYGRSIYDITVNKPAEKSPGELWKYQGGNTLLLSFILKQASGLSLSDYFSKHVWGPIGANQSALWTISEEDSLERSYCCFYSNARGYAKVGQLYLDSGSVNGLSIVPKEYFLKSIQAVNIKNDSGNIIDYYGLQWWLGEYAQHSFFYARGILGQYIVVVPSLDLVIVRLGHLRDNKRNVKIPSDLFLYLEAAFALNSQVD